MAPDRVRVPAPCFITLAAMLPTFEIAPVTDPASELLMVSAPPATMFAAVKAPVLIVNAPVAVKAPLIVTELGVDAAPTMLIA